MHSRHTAISDVIHRSLVLVKIPSHLEPTGLSKSNGKRPDGMSIASWGSLAALNVAVALI